MGGDRPQASRADERGPQGFTKGAEAAGERSRLPCLWRPGADIFIFIFFTFYVFLYDRVFGWTEVQRAEFITAIRVSFSSLAPVSPPLVSCLEFLFSGPLSPHRQFV